MVVGGAYPERPGEPPCQVIEFSLTLLKKIKCMNLLNVSRVLFVIL